MEACSPPQERMRRANFGVCYRRKRVETHKAFFCIFASCGGDRTYGGKNEWKRHINTFHLRLESWICDLPPCDEQRHSGRRTFNRKDLFNQHLRRVHPGALGKPAMILERCRSVRTPPSEAVCAFCLERFSGDDCWPTFLEHVGQHIEKLKASSA